MSNGAKDAERELTPDESKMIETVIFNEHMSNERIDNLVQFLSTCISQGRFKTALLYSGIVGSNEEADAFAWFYYERWCDESTCREDD